MAGIQGEHIALPVDRGAQAPHLFGDHAAGGFLPLPDPLDEGLATQFHAALPRGIQLTLDHHLRGDSRMIGARLPQGVESAHAVVAGQRVHDGVLERMPHVQRAGDIGRRDDDGKGRTLAARREETGGFPPRIDARLDIRG